MDGRHRSDTEYTTAQFKVDMATEFGEFRVTL